MASRDSIRKVSFASSVLSGLDQAEASVRAFVDDVDDLGGGVGEHEELAVLEQTELQDRLVPIEDVDVSKELARAYKKMGVKIMTGSSVDHVDTSGDQCLVTIKTKKGEETMVVDQVLSAVGVVGNVEGFGLDEVLRERDRRRGRDWLWRP